MTAVEKGQPSPVMSLRGISFDYGGAAVLQDINLDIQPGEFLGIEGPNGGGKTTLLKIMLGLLRPRRGTVHAFGREIRRALDLKGQISYVPQSIGEFPPGFPATALELVVSGRAASRGLLRPYRPADYEAAREALAMVDLEHLASVKVTDLSGGQQQRVFIARALAARAPVMFLDEPTAAVDPGTQEVFTELLARLHKEQRLTMAIVSHDLDMLSRLVTRRVCLNRTLYAVPGGCQS